MNYLITAGIALIGTLFSVAGIYNYLPLDVLQFNKPELVFGSTITTINGTDTLSSSRAVINTNFANLNSTKIENSTTSVAAITTLANLSSIGTITTGSWNGTAIPVNKGGTGTTSPTVNQVMLGDTTNGFKVVAGLGTSGYFLTSNGAGQPPTWQSSAIDQGATYTWTGANMWTASSTHTATTSFAGTNALSNAVIFNGVPYSFPSTQGASSTVLTNNGSGRFTNETLPWLNIGETTFAGAATTTLTLTSTTTAQDIRIVARGVTSGANCEVWLQYNPNTTAGRASNYAWSLKPGNDGAVLGATSNAARLADQNGQTSAQFMTTIDLVNDAGVNKEMTWSGSEFGQVFWGSTTFSDTTDQLKSLNISLWNCTSGAGTMTSGRITVYASQN